MPWRTGPIEAGLTLKNLKNFPMPAPSSVPRLLVIAAALALAFFAGRRTADTSSVSPSLATSSTGAASTSGNAMPSGVADPANAASASARGTKKPAQIQAVLALPVTNLAGEDERQRLIEDWAATEPRAALEFIRTKLQGDRQAQAFAAVLAIWGKNDPAAAWAWLSATMPEATHHFDTLLEVFGRESTATAARYAAEFSKARPDAAVEVHMAALLGITHRGDFEGARSMVENNPALDAETRATLNNFIAGQWGRYAPEAAVKWVMTLPEGPSREQALIGLGESWSERDPAGATAFAVTLPGGPTRALALRQSVAKWVMTDAAAARAWVVDTKRHDDFDHAVMSIATDPNLYNRQPGRALNWAATIFDDQLRDESINSILNNWYPVDPAGAKAFIESSRDFTPEQRADLLRRLQAVK